MNSPRDMAECECRNASGYPAVGDNFRGYMHAPVDNSQNKALPWISFSWFLSGGAVLGILILSLTLPSLIDSRVEARVARAEVLAEQARKDAGIAKDMVDIDRAKRKALEELKK